MANRTGNRSNELALGGSQAVHYWSDFRGLVPVVQTAHRHSGPRSIIAERESEGPSLADTGRTHKCGTQFSPAFPQMLAMT